MAIHLLNSYYSPIIYLCFASFINYCLSQMLNRPGVYVSDSRGPFRRNYFIPISHPMMRDEVHRRELYGLYAEEPLLRDDEIIPLLNSYAPRREVILLPPRNDVPPLAEDPMHGHDHHEHSESHAHYHTLKEYPNEEVHDHHHYHENEEHWH